MMGNIKSEDMFINCIWFFGLIFSSHTVVVLFLQKIIVIYGARTHSARRYVAIANVYNGKTFRRVNIINYL